MLLSVQLTYFASDGGNSTPSLLLLALFLILCKTTLKKIDSRFARMTVHVLVRAARASASRPSVAYEMNGHLRTTVLGARQYTHTTGKKKRVCVPRLLRQPLLCRRKADTLHTNPPEFKWAASLWNNRLSPRQNSGFTTATRFFTCVKAWHQSFFGSRVSKLAPPVG